MFFLYRWHVLQCDTTLFTISLIFDNDIPARFHKFSNFLKKHDQIVYVV